MKQLADLRGSVAKSRIQERAARDLNGIIEVLEVGFSGIEIDATECLEGTGFLNVEDVIRDAEFCTHGFVAQDGELDNHGQRVQDIEAVIGVFGIVGDIGAGHIYFWGRKSLCGWGKYCMWIIYIYGGLYFG